MSMMVTRMVGLALALAALELAAAPKPLEGQLGAGLLGQWDFTSAKNGGSPDLAGGKYPAVLRSGCVVVDNPRGDKAMKVAENKGSGKGFGMPDLKREMDAFTVSFWLYPYDVSENRHTIGPGWDYFCFHGAKDGAAYIGVNGARLSPGDAIPPGTLAKEQWQMLTYAYSDNMGYFYKNGELVAFAPTGNPKPWNGFNFGSDLLGCVGPVYIHDRKLDGAEVERLYDIDRDAFAMPSVSLALDNSTYGFFQRGKPLPFKLRGAGRVKIDIEDIDGKTVSSSEPDASSFALSAPERCGIYWAKAVVTASDGAKLLEQEFPFAVTVELPPLAEVDPDGAPLGCCVALDSLAGDSAFIGMKWTRFWGGLWSTWYHIEAKKGVYDWRTLDKQVERALQNGYAILYTVHGVPDWAAVKPGQPFARGNDAWPPRDINDLKDFVRALALRYKGKIKAYDIFNEQIRGMSNAPGFTGCSSQEYVKLLKAAYVTIKEVDPAALVVGVNDHPSSTTKTADRGVVDGFEEVMAQGGLKYMDVLAIHNYNMDNPDLCFRELGYEAKLRAMLKRFGRPELPMWDTESSFLTPSRVKNRPMSEEDFAKLYGNMFKSTGTKCFNEAGGIVMAPELRSACWEIQACLLAYACGVQRRFIFSLDNNVYGTRILEKGVAFAALVKFLGDSRAWMDFRVLDMGGDAANGVLLTRAPGRTDAVVWASGPKPTPMTLLVEGDREIKGLDFLGNPVVVGKASQGMLKLTLGQEPLYLLDVPAGLKGVYPLKLEKRDGVILPGSPFKDSLTITNPFPKAMDFTLAVEKPASWTVSKLEPLRLEPGASKTVEFTVDGAADEGLHEVAFTLLAEGRAEAFVAGSFLLRAERPLAKAKRHVTVDGDVAEWADVPGVKVESYPHVVVGKQKAGVPEAAYPHWFGPQDLSYEVKLAWEGDSVYFLLDVTDGMDTPRACPEATLAAKPWEYDCANVYVNYIGASKDIGLMTGSTLASQLIVVPELGAAAQVCGKLATNPAFDREGGFNTKFAGRKTEKGYLVEGRLTAGRQFKFAEGTLLALDFAVDDRDDVRGLRKTQMVMTGGSDRNQARPQDWGLYRLAK